MILKLIEKDLDILFKSNSGKWDKQIDFSTKDIYKMLNLPLSSITEYIREYKIKVSKYEFLVT